MITRWSRGEFQLRMGLTHRETARGIDGKIASTLIVAAMMGLGLWFVGVFAIDAVRIARTYWWKAVDCEIIASGVNESDVSRSDTDWLYTFIASYRYTVGGRQYRSGRVGLSGLRVLNYMVEHPDAYTDAQRLLDRFPRGTRAVCFVNPANAAEAILVRAELWSMIFILLPLAGVYIGARAIYGLWMRPRQSGQTPSSA